jgi:rSAM/selenodomain-associated transferase 1
MENYKKSALAIFCRAPRLGQVKTRIAQTHGDEFALDLYLAMLRDTFDLAHRLEPDKELFVCFTPDDSFEEEGENSLFEIWKGRKFPQYEGDLGAKILGCFSTLRAIGFEKIVAIGSDSPDLPLSHLQKAFDELAKHDAVIGESGDGGFYLLGSKRPLPSSLFNRVVWSGENVFSDVTLNLRLTARFTFKTLPAWNDIDDSEDIEQLRHRLFTMGTHARWTKAFLKN